MIISPFFHTWFQKKKSKVYTVNNRILYPFLSLIIENQRQTKGAHAYSFKAKDYLPYMHCIKKKLISPFFHWFLNKQKKKKKKWERSSSVVECLIETEGPQSQASPASLCCVLEQEH